MAGIKFTKNKKLEFIEKFVQNNFNMTKTCKEIGVSHISYYHAVKHDPVFNEKIKELKDTAKALIDNALLRGVNDSDPMVAARYLDMLGKYKSFQNIYNIEQIDNEEDDITRNLTKDDFLM